MSNISDIFGGRRKGLNHQSTKLNVPERNKKVLYTMASIKVYDDAVDDSCLYGLIFGEELQHYLSMNTDICDVLRASEEVFVSFRFDWQSYKSWVIITSEACSREISLVTPRIPLLGGVWSNTVANRMLIGQVLVSSMLTSVANQVNFVIRKLNLTTKVIKLDKCFYAPFLYYTVDEFGQLCDSCDTTISTHKEYFNILTKGNPDAYTHLVSLYQGESYWKSYHDKLSV